MQYGEIIRKAWRITWRFRYLWILGLFAGITGPGGSGFSSPGSSSNSSQTGSSTRPFGLTRQALLADIRHWLPFALVVLLALFVIGLAFAILRIAARGGLVWAVDGIEQGGSPRLGHAWDVGFSRFWRLLGLGLVTGIPLLLGVGLIAAGIGVPIAAAVARGGGAAAAAAIVPVCGTLVIGIPALIILGVVLGVMRVIGERGIVLEDRGVFDAAGSGWHALRTRFKDTILMWLISWGLSILASLVIAIPIIIFTVVIVVPGVIAAVGGSWGAVAAFATLWVLIIVAISLAYSAIWGTFTSSLWTVFFRRLTGREQPLPAPAPAYWPPGAPAPGLPYGSPPGAPMGPPMAPWGPLPAGTTAPPGAVAAPSPAPPSAPAPPAQPPEAGPPVAPPPEGAP